MYCCLFIFYMKCMKLMSVLTKLSSTLVLSVIFSGELFLNNSVSMQQASKSQNLKDEGYLVKMGEEVQFLKGTGRGLEGRVDNLERENSKRGFCAGCANFCSILAHTVQTAFYILAIYALIRGIMLFNEYSDDAQDSISAAIDNNS